MAKKKIKVTRKFRPVKSRLRVSSPGRTRPAFTASVGPSRVSLSHPEVVDTVTISGGRGQLAFARRAALATVRLIRKNIETQHEGQWAPLVSRPGRKALRTRKKDWTARKTDKGYVVKTDHFWWATHTEGKTIVPKRGKFLRFKMRGKVVFARKVVVPRRDPRPTADQLIEELRR